jgi:2-phospho-L-lactate guanylyltransferase (CobY/MobA/RfbA family)
LIAPQLAMRIYANNVRVLMDDLNELERVEVKRLLKLAKDAPPSAADGTDPVTTSERRVPRKATDKSIKDCSR